MTSSRIVRRGLHPDRCAGSDRNLDRNLLCWETADGREAGRRIQVRRVSETWNEWREGVRADGGMR